MGVGEQGEAEKTWSKHRRSFVPQWTINRLTQERNSKYSCLNRLKLEGGGVGRTEVRGNGKGERGECKRTLSILHLGTCIYYYHIHLSKISSQYFNASCPYFKSSYNMVGGRRPWQSNSPPINNSKDILRVILIYSIIRQAYWKNKIKMSAWLFSVFKSTLQGTFMEMKYIRNKNA